MQTPFPGERSLARQVNWPLSCQLATQFATEQGHCFRNAWRTFILSPERFRDGHYIEGWYVVDSDGTVLMTEHGWIEDAAGTIIDPSVVWLVEPETPVWYYPGVTRTWEETEALEGAMFPQVRFDGLHGPDGLRHPAYKAARDAARSKVYALAQAHQPPKPMHFWIARDEPSAMPTIPARPTVLSDRTLQVRGTIPFDLPSSLEIATLLPAQAGHCWHNARDAMRQLPQRLFKASYVEGWLVEERPDAIRIIEHGWLRAATGIVDPTLILDEPPVGVEYVAGITTPWREIQQYTGFSFPRARYGTPYLLEYQSACQQALDHAEHLGWQTGLPVVPTPGSVTRLDQQGLHVLTWDFPVLSSPSERVRAFLRDCQGAEER